MYNGYTTIDFESLFTLDCNNKGTRGHMAKLSQWRRQDFCLGGRIEAPKGAVPPPQKIFDYLSLKWRILMHI